MLKMPNMKGNTQLRKLSKKLYKERRNGQYIENLVRSKIDNYCYKGQRNKKNNEKISE